MAKTVTFVDLPAPTNLTGVALAGGTLEANTTYYYKVIAVFSVAFTSSSYTNMQGKSLASNEFSITTTATNKKIKLTWNFPKGVCGGYRIYRSTTAGAQVACLATAQVDSINIAGVCNWSDTGIVVGGNVIFQNTSHGKLVLTGSALGDEFSIVDLYNADVAGGWGVVTKVDNSTYRVDAYIQGHNYAYWIDEEKTIIIADEWSAGLQSNYRFGRITGEITNRGCTIIFKTPNLSTFSPYTLNAYKTIFNCVLDFNPNCLTYYGITLITITFNSGLVQDCQSNKMRGFQPLSLANCTLKNFIATEYDVGFSAGAATFINCIAINGSRPFQTAAWTVMRVKNFISINNTYTILVIGTNNQITMINTNVSPESYSNTYACAGSWIDERFTYTLTVTNNDNITPIANASVKIYDIFNNIICDTTTDVNGSIVEQELLFRKITYDSSSPSIRTATVYAPHKLVITASGFETYTEITNYTGCFATSKTIGLKPILQMRYDVEGNIYKAITPELGSSAKIIKI